jgi:hypothetical protein
MPTLADIFEVHAEDCTRSAETTDDLKHRDLLVKLASQWREDAEALKQGEELLKLASAWRKAKASRRVAESAPSNAAPAPTPRRRSAR